MRGPKRANRGDGAGSPGPRRSGTRGGSLAAGEHHRTRARGSRAQGQGVQDLHRVLDEAAVPRGKGSEATGRRGRGLGEERRRLDGLGLDRRCLDGRPGRPELLRSRRLARHGAQREVLGSSASVRERGCALVCRSAASARSAGLLRISK